MEPLGTRLCNFREPSYVTFGSPASYLPWARLPPCTGLYGAPSSSYPCIRYSCQFCISPNHPRCCVGVCSLASSRREWLFCLFRFLFHSWQMSRSTNVRASVCVCVCVCVCCVVLMQKVTRCAAAHVRSTCELWQQCRGLGVGQQWQQASSARKKQNSKILQ